MILLLLLLAWLAGAFGAAYADGRWLQGPTSVGVYLCWPVLLPVTLAFGPILLLAYYIERTDPIGAVYRLGQKQAAKTKLPEARVISE